ncbi:MAG: FlgD immunoglobulin-like domain containing protein [bacterium]
MHSARKILLLLALAIAIGAAVRPALAAGPIVSGETLAGTLAGPTFTESWTFTGTTGDRVLLAAATTSGAVNTNIVVKNPSGVTILSSSTDRGELLLAATGTFTIDISDVGLNDAGTYNLCFVDLTAGPLTSAGDPDGGAIVSSDVKTGTMVVADFDAYTFSGTSGDRVLIDAVTTSGSLDTWIYLYPPAGAGAVINSFAADRAEIQLTATGTYTIVIEDNLNNTPGGYSMSFLNVTSGPFTNGSDIDGGAIASNEIKTGQFNQGVDFDAYTFSGTTGQRIVVGGVATGAGTHNTQISVYPAGGGAALTFTATDRFDVQLTTSGTYTLVIEDNLNNDVGTYTISFVNLTAGPYADGSDPDGGAIVSSDVKTGTMSGVADFDAYTFSGTSGDRVLIDAVTTSGSLDTWIYLYPPGGGGAVINSFAADRAEIQLTATGTYTIVIEDNLNNTPGGYSMSFLNVTSGPFTNGSDIDGGVIVSNEIKTGQFNQGVDFDGFTFEGTAGDRIVVAGVATGAGTHNTQISVYPAGGGGALASTSTDRFDVQLTTSGTHTLVIEDNLNNDAGTYTISFVNITQGPLKDANDADGGVITSNDIKSGTMSGVADFDGYQFVGSIGNRVLISAVTTSGSLDTWIYLYPPSGGGAVVTSFAGDRAEFQLTSTGLHTIVIEDNGNNTAGGYNMSFLNVSAGPMSGGTPETDGGPVIAGPMNGSALAASDFDGYTFFGTSGQTANITAAVTSGPMNTQISLYPPGGGGALLSTTTDNVVQALSATGTYTIVIEDNLQDQTGNYTLTVTGTSFATDVPGGDLEPAEAFRTTLFPASPSPFLNSTRLDFRVAQEGPVQLRIYDVTGSLVRTLVDETLRPGAHPAVWDGIDSNGSRVASGIYYVQLQTGGEVKKQKVVRIR